MLIDEGQIKYCEQIELDHFIISLLQSWAIAFEHILKEWCVFPSSSQQQQLRFGCLGQIWHFALFKTLLLLNVLVLLPNSSELDATLKLRQRRTIAIGYILKRDGVPFPPLNIWVNFRNFKHFGRETCK